MTMIRKELRVTGRVQGVGFRYQTMELARVIGLTGWVRNNLDGSVTLQVQGQSEKVVQFTEKLGQAIRFARIDYVSEKDIEPQTESSFRVLV